MRLKLTLNRPSRAEAGEDVVVTTDGDATIGALAEALAEALASRDPRRNGHGADAAPDRASALGSVRGGRVRARPLRAVAGDQGGAGQAGTRPGELTLQVDGPDGAALLSPSLAVVDAGLQDGRAVSIVDGRGVVAAGGARGPTAAVLTVVEGPDQGARFELPVGASHVGRGAANEVQVTDPLVSKRHVRVNVTDMVEVVDLGSANGVIVGGERVQRAALPNGDAMVLGDDVIAVEHLGSSPAAVHGSAVAFNRSPVLDPVFGGAELVAPEPPQPESRRRFSVILFMIPLLMGALLFSITRNPLSVIFLALSPLMLVGNYLDSRLGARRRFDASAQDFRASLSDLSDQLATLAVVESAARQREHPATSVVVDGATRRTPILWCRRADRRGFLELRLGLGTLPSRTTVKLPAANRTTPELWNELLSVPAGHARVDDVPLVAALPEIGAVGIAGPRHEAVPAARAVLAQVVGLHSPAEVVLCAVASTRSALDWDWLKWLPHTSSEQSPVECEHLAAGTTAASTLVAALDEIVATRLGAGGAGRPSPAIVVLVEDDLPIDRSRVVALAEAGRRAAVYVVWVSPTAARLPAVCRVFSDLDPNSGVATVGFVDDGSHAAPIVAERLEAAPVEAFARALAPVVDAGARLEDDSDLPTSTSFLDHVGLELARSPAAILERWRSSGSMPADPSGPRRRRPAGDLAAYVGRGGKAPVELDLRAHGPHALVGGTTGAGKSELLQTWVTALAANHSPAKVTFLFVDYKGGAAFSECVRLPHCVGLVTDLTPYLVKRALRSLNAEVRHREGVLQRKKAKDVLDLEKAGDPDTPPSLVIVVDEFAALVTEVPDFVEGVVNVAQRGRSLGLHLILATQRPGGVINPALSASSPARRP